MCLGSLGDILANEKSHLSNLGKQIADDPLQVLVGGTDPASAAVWNSVLGTDWEPLFTSLGGETEAQYKQSEAEGVDTGPSRTLGHIADAIALYYAGSYAYGAYAAYAAGGAGAAGGAAAGGASGAAAGGTLGGADVAASAGVMGGTAASGAGAGYSAGAGAGAGAGGAAGGMTWGNAARTFGPTLLQSALQPRAAKAPKTRDPIGMPDPLAQAEARKRKVIDQAARRGRASTILTNPSGGLGG